MGCTGYLAIIPACNISKYYLRYYYRQIPLQLMLLPFIQIPSTDVIWLTLTLKMTTAQVVETSVTVNNNPIQDYMLIRRSYSTYLWTFLKQVACFQQKIPTGVHSLLDDEGLTEFLTIMKLLIELLLYKPDFVPWLHNCLEVTQQNPSLVYITFYITFSIAFKHPRIGGLLGSYFCKCIVISLPSWGLWHPDIKKLRPPKCRKLRPLKQCFPILK